MSDQIRIQYQQRHDNNISDDYPTEETLMCVPPIPMQVCAYSSTDTYVGTSPVLLGIYGMAAAAAVNTQTLDDYTAYECNAYQ